MKNPIVWIIALVIVAGGGYWVWHNSAKPGALSDDGTSLATDAVDDAGGNATSSTAAAGTASEQSEGAAMSAAVTYNGTSFSPSTVTVKLGGTVTWTDTSGQMWVASDPHPIHNGYDGTTRQEHCAPGYTGATPFDECTPGATYSFTFTKSGSWGYHDHLNHSALGTVVVQ